jgi:RimJ/RimL family protein N-acetyltransferase
MREIETERLRLRRFTADDLGAVRRIYGDAEVMRYMWDGRARTEEQIRDALDYLIESWVGRDFGMWAVVHKEEGVVIGRCGLGLLDGKDEVEVGYILARAYWGGGYATEAARAVLRDGFERVGLERIIAVTRPDHVASQRIMVKLGMRYEKDAYYYGATQVYYAIERRTYRPSVDLYHLHEA